MASSPRPEPALRRALRLAPRDWLDVARAVGHLARARLVHRSRTAADLLALARRQGAGGLDEDFARRIALAIPRAAARVPWRADCFVQALAAQAWLRGRGLGSELTIGVRTDAPQGFAAHAWLRHGQVTVTGGDFTAYTPLVTPDTPLR